MRGKVVVLNIRKNEILIRKVKKERSRQNIYYYVSIVIIVLFAFMCLGNNDIKNSCVGVFSPVNSLYSDNSDIVFTGITERKLEFTLPILGGIVEEGEGEIIFTVGKSIMVMAIEDGVVSDCGQSLDGVKYIKIVHSANVFSVLENVDIIGVNKYDNVKRGQDIATGKVGERVKLKIFKNDMLLHNLSINQSKIVWEN